MKIAIKHLNFRTKKVSLAFLTALALLTGITHSMTACTAIDDSDAAAIETAENFAQAFFNYDFHKAEPFVTPESRKWLRFAASNAAQDDLDLINECNAQAKVDMIEETSADTLLLVHLLVSDYVKPALLGQKAVRSDKEGLFPLTMVLRDGSWQVKLEGLPRSCE